MASGAGDTRLGGMNMLPISPRPFFADKNKAFWRLQLLGWGGAFLSLLYRAPGLPKRQK